MISNHSHICQLQFATHAFGQKLLQQAVQRSICQVCSIVSVSADTKIYVFACLSFQQLGDLAWFLKPSHKVELISESLLSTLR